MLRTGTTEDLDFETLAEKIGLIPKRARQIMDGILGRPDNVLAMVHNSFLSTVVCHTKIFPDDGIET